MNGQQHFAVVERSLDAGFQLVRYALTAGLFGGLIVAWIVTAPLFHCGILLGDACRRRELKLKWR